MKLDARILKLGRYKRRLKELCSNDVVNWRCIGTHRTSRNGVTIWRSKKQHCVIHHHGQRNLRSVSREFGHRFVQKHQQAPFGRVTIESGYCRDMDSKWKGNLDREPTNHVCPSISRHSSHRLNTRKTSRKIVLRPRLISFLLQGDRLFKSKLSARGVSINHRETSKNN